jgi:dihydroxy-acid dehydratase
MAENAPTPGQGRTGRQLRSYRWFGDAPTAAGDASAGDAHGGGASAGGASAGGAGAGASGLRALGHRSRMRQLGFAAADHLGKPFIAILNTWSEINPCHMHLRERADQVRRGVLQAGGFPLEFGVASLSEAFQKPTPMLYRNLLAMEAEELLRSYPVDGAVLMGGCDKTTPALLMGAASAGIPAIFVPAGPMLRGNFRGAPLGSGTDLWKYWDDYRAGLIGDCELAELEGGIARSPGHCMTMGTASTMTSAAEALGMTLPGAASIPAVDSAHYRMAAASGRRIVEMVWENLTPAQILTREAFEDAAATVLSLGGSTNALIHLIAMAGRCGVPFSLRDFDAIARRVPVLANIRPGGTYLMEDFYYAGGLPALLGQLAAVPGALHPDRPAVSGAAFGAALSTAVVHDDDVIRPASRPLSPEGGVAVLHGNLAPRGAVIKHLAADPRLLRHTGPAVVFDGYPDIRKRIDDPSLQITAGSVLVLRGAGPIGGPGMPEYGMLPIPRYLLARGVRDMVRISDARMSGTSYGACVLHVAPESAAGGPLALVRTGDLVTLDVAARSLRLEVSDEELARRRAAWQPPSPACQRGYAALYRDHVTQADQGCDFDFLARPGVTPEPDPC